MVAENVQGIPRREGFGFDIQGREIRLRGTSQRTVQRPNLRLIRAVFNYGVKIGYLRSNPALNLEFVYRPKVEVKPLPNEIVRGMLNDAAANPQRIELLPYLALGFGTGCREAELFKILWSDVLLGRVPLTDSRQRLEDEAEAVY
jgi:integrase